MGFGSPRRGGGPDPLLQDLCRKEHLYPPNPLPNPPPLKLRGVWESVWGAGSIVSPTVNGWGDPTPLMNLAKFWRTTKHSRTVYRVTPVT